MIIVCNIFCYKQDDHDVLVDYLKSYPVKITMDKDILNDGEKPMLIVGWDYVKEIYPEQNILNKKIKKSLYWTYSFSEKKDIFLKHSKSFVEKSLINWLPKNFVLYDYFFDGDLKLFFDKNINFENKVFLYFHEGAIYINNNDKNFIINIKNLKHFNILNDKEIFDIINNENSITISHDNMCSHIQVDDFRGVALDSLLWVKHNFELDEDFIFNVIPGFEYKKYISFFMNILFPKDEITTDELLFLNRMKTRDFVTTWASNRSICVESNIDLNKKEIIQKDNKSFVILNYSNKRTKTNRIVCKDQWNIQNEPKDSLRRKKVISRFEGGKILVCDYNSFETRISMFLTKDSNFIKKYKDKDIHTEIAREIIFKNNIVSPEERGVAKTINHALLYGASHNRLKEILPNNYEDDEKEEIIYFVKNMLEPIITNSKKINEECNKGGYIKTPWGSIVRPDKEYAAYNNLVQTIASEIIVDKMVEFIELLKNKESQFLFQIHDSMIFDISPDDGGIISEIINTMSVLKNSKLNVSCKIGDNYFDLVDFNDLAC